MTVQGEILVTQVENVLAVPVGAVIRFDDQDHLAVRKPDGGFELRAVTLGLSNDREVEVRMGLESGEAVSLSPRKVLSEAQKRALDRDPPAPTPPAAPGAAAEARRRGIRERTRDAGRRESGTP
jgi:multidrug efflux pump subunit AcrA (membrane-fusion protein)